VPIRLLLVHDCQMVLDGLRAMLRPHAGEVEVVAATTDLAEARRLAVDSRPAVSDRAQAVAFVLREGTFR